MWALHSEEKIHPPWVRVAATAAAVLAATLLARLFSSWTDSPFIMAFVAAVAFSRWFAGLNAAGLATLLSVVSYATLITGPFGEWPYSRADFPRVLAFLLIATLISVLSIRQDQAEASLRSSERRLRTMLETANEGVWLIDRDGYTHYINNRMVEWLGATPEDVAAVNCLEFVFPDDLEDARHRIAVCLGGLQDEFDFRLRRSDMRELRVRISASPVRNDHGRVVGILGLVTDMTARWRAEEALNRANERFALAAEAVQSMIYEWDPHTRREERSGALLSLTGFAPHEAEPDSDWWRARVHPADTALLLDEQQVRQMHEDRYSHEYRVRHRDGYWVTVWDQGRLVREADGSVARVIGSIVDITARTEAERALRILSEAGRVLSSSLELDEILQRVAWTAVPAMADWCLLELLEPDGSLRRVAVAHADPNKAAFAKQVMQARSMLQEHPLVRGVLERGDPFHMEEVSDALMRESARSPEHYEFLSGYNIASSIVVPLQARGVIYGAMSLIASKDSGRTFRKADLELAEQLARRSAMAILNGRLYQEAHAAEERFRNLFEGIKDGIVVVDSASICIDVNSALLEMTGYRRDEVVGSSTSTITDDGPWIEEIRKQLQQTGEWRGEFDLRHKNGDIVPVESWITRVKLPSGLVSLGVLRDVSERKQFEEVQGEFLATLAHDLKNPLTTVRGQTQLMRRRLERGDGLDAQRLRTGLEAIDTAAIRITKLMDELGDVMRLRAGHQIDLHREPTDLVELVQRAMQEHARVSESHAMRLDTELTTLQGYWDGQRLERVLANLLGNAIKYSPNGGEIVIGLQQQGIGRAAEAVVTVSDRGVGIPACDLELIFDRFQRAGNVHSFAGSGIGLAGVKRIVELHDGVITVQSVEGAGSTFTVRLPIVGEEEGGASVPPG